MDYESPFAPEVAAPQAGGLDAGGIANQWREWMGQPQNRAAMLQFGVALMQPVGLGQTPMGHFGQAVGQGGEAAARVNKLEAEDAELARKQQETDSLSAYRRDKSESDAVRADAATTRAQAATANAESQARLRESQVAMNQARITMLATRIRDLEVRTSLFPEDQAAKRDLDAARAELARANADLATTRAGTVVDDSATRQQNVQSQIRTREQNAQTRKDAVTSREKTATEANQVRREGQMRRSEDNERKAFEKYVADNKLLDPKFVAPTFENWKKTYGGQPAPKYFRVDPSALDKYPDAKQAPDGNFYVQR